MLFVKVSRLLLSLSQIPTIRPTLDYVIGYTSAHEHLNLRGIDWSLEKVSKAEMRRVSAKSEIYIPPVEKTRPSHTPLNLRTINVTHIFLMSSTISSWVSTYCMGNRSRVEVRHPHYWYFSHGPICNLPLAKSEIVMKHLDSIRYLLCEAYALDLSRHRNIQAVSGK